MTSQEIEIVCSRLRAGVTCSIWEAGQRYHTAALIEELWRENQETKSKLHGLLRAVGVEADQPDMIGQEGE